MASLHSSRKCAMQQLISGMPCTHPDGDKMSALDFLWGSDQFAKGKRQVRCAMAEQKLLKMEMNALLLSLNLNATVQGFEDIAGHAKDVLAVHLPLHMLRWVYKSLAEHAAVPLRAHGVVCAGGLILHAPQQRAHPRLSTQFQAVLGTPIVLQLLVSGATTQTLGMYLALAHWCLDATAFTVLAHALIHEGTKLSGLVSLHNLCQLAQFLRPLTNIVLPDADHVLVGIVEQAQAQGHKTYTDTDTDAFYTRAHEKVVRAFAYTPPPASASASAAVAAAAAAAVAAAVASSTLLK